MLIKKLLFIVIITLSIFTFNSVSNAANIPNSKVLKGDKLQSSKTLENSMQQSLASDLSSNTSANNQISTNKDLVVVSKNPEFFTYILSAISILLTVVVIIVGFMGGLGFLIVRRIDNKVNNLETMKKSFEKEQEELRNQLQDDCKKHLNVLELTALGLGTINRAKTNLRNLLASDAAAFPDVYKEVQKTIISPDEECLRLYAQVLQKYEDKIDMIRLIRNGLLEYARNPHE